MSSNAKPRVFVTGASGFLGSHVVFQLLEAGYPVIGAARGSKLPLLERVFARYPDFEAVDVPDVASSELTEKLKSVEAIIHTAAPLPGRADVETLLKSAIEGVVHVIREGARAGVKRVVVTSSTVSFPFTGPWGVNGELIGIPSPKKSKEGASAGDHWAAYTAAKKFADQAALEFADAHPEIDVTILSPCWLFGPFVPGFEHLIPTPNFKAFSTNSYIYALLRPQNTHYPPSGGVVDIRDVARAHILALDSSPSAVVGRKRYLVVSPYKASYSDAIKVIANERPELRERLADPRKAPSFALQKGLDWKGLEDVVGFKAGDYRPWKETVLDTVDSLIALEKKWEADGHEVVQPEGKPFWRYMC